MSNRLPTLAADLSRLHGEIGHHHRAAAEKMLAAGQLLTEAKALAEHGAWLPFLADAGIPAQKAQRYMRLWQAGLKYVTVTHLDGLRGSLAFLSAWKMPGPAEALHVEIGEGEACNFAFIWRDQDNPEHVVIAACIGDQTIRTKRPMLPRIEIEGFQPVDTVLEWLLSQGLGPIAEWRVETVDLRLAQAVINPLIWFAMVGEHGKSLPANKGLA